MSTSVHVVLESDGAPSEIAAEGDSAGGDGDGGGLGSGDGGDGDGGSGGRGEGRGEGDGGVGGEGDGCTRPPPHSQHMVFEEKSASS